MPWPEIDADLLPIAEIECMRGEITNLSTARRRKLLPMETLQDILSCCECHDAPAPPVDDGPADTDTDTEGPWTRPEESQLGELIGDILSAFADPNFAKLTVAQVFGAAQGPVAARAAADPAAGRTAGPAEQAFVASLFVSSDASLEKFKGNDWAGVFAEATGGQPRSRTSTRIGRTARSGVWFEGASAADLRNRTIRQILPVGFDGYTEFEGVFGGESAGDWAAMSLDDVVANVEQLSNRAQAAAIWMFFRLSSALDPR